MIKENDDDVQYTIELIYPSENKTFPEHLTIV